VHAGFDPEAAHPLASPVRLKYADHYPIDLHLGGVQEFAAPAVVDLDEVAWPPPRREEIEEYDEGSRDSHGRTPPEAASRCTHGRVILISSTDADFISSAAADLEP